MNEIKINQKQTKAVKNVDKLIFDTRKFNVSRKNATESIKQKQNMLIKDEALNYKQKDMIMKMSLDSVKHKENQTKSLSFAAATIASNNKNIQSTKLCNKGTSLKQTIDDTRLINKVSINLVKNNLKKVKSELPNKIAEKQRALHDKIFSKKCLKTAFSVIEKKNSSSNLVNCARSVPIIHERKTVRSSSAPPIDRDKCQTLTEDFIAIKSHEARKSWRNDATEKYRTRSLGNPMRFDDIKRFFNMIELRRCNSLSSITKNSYDAHSFHFKTSTRFKDLHKFFSNLERIDKLKRSISCTDVSKISNDRTLIDYDIWKKLHDKNKARKELEDL